MPVQNGDRVLAVNVSTGATSLITIPPTDPSIRPILTDPNYGQMTIPNLVRQSMDGLIQESNIQVYVDRMSEDMARAVARVPYLDYMEGDADTLVYVATNQFDPSLDYIVVQSSEDADAVRTVGSTVNLGGSGAGGRGGGGGGGRTGSGGERGEEGEGSDEGEVFSVTSFNLVDNSS